MKKGLFTDYCLIHRCKKAATGDNFRSQWLLTTHDRVHMSATVGRVLIPDVFDLLALIFGGRYFFFRAPDAITTTSHSFQH